MNKFSVAATTILGIRVLVALFQKSQTVIFGLRFYHLYLGILMLLAGIISLQMKLSAKTKNRITIAVGIGLGLVLDEIFFLLFTDGTRAQYFSGISVIGAGLFAILALFLTHGQNRN